MSGASNHVQKICQYVLGIKDQDYYSVCEEPGYKTIIDFVLSSGLVYVNDTVGMWKSVIIYSQWGLTMCLSLESIGRRKIYPIS